MVSRTVTAISRRGIQLENRFVIDQKAGSGFQGQVFKARDQKLDRDVALKKITKGVDAIEHAKAITRMPHHEALVIVFDVVELEIPVGSTKEQFVVMEWLAGKVLEACIPWNDGVESAKRIIKQIVDAANHMHSHGFVHGDIHPQNVMINGENVKLFDVDPNRLNTLAKMGGEGKSEAIEKDFRDILGLGSKLGLKLKSPITLQYKDLCSLLSPAPPPTSTPIVAPSTAKTNPIALPATPMSVAPFNSILLTTSSWNADLARALRSLLESPSPNTINLFSLPWNIQERVDTINVLIRTNEYPWSSSEGMQELRDIRRLARRLLIEIAP